MKKITKQFMMLAVTLLISGSAAAIQTGPTTMDFETVGHDWAWTIFENGTNDPTLYEVVSNPSATGINTSSKVAKYIVNDIGMPWAGLWSNNLPDFTLSAENCIVKVKVYKGVVSDFLVKFENENASVAFEKKVSNTQVNQWEELTFDFSAWIGTAVTRLVIIPDFPASRTAGSTNYWDDISFNASSSPAITVPTVASPLPSLAASKVISMHSRAYTNVGVDTWRTDWSNASYSEVQVDGTTVKKYNGLVFVGIETTGANFINASGMTHFHVDVWTPDMTTFRVKLVDFGANAAWSGGDDVEHELSFTPELSKWVSLDIALSDFTALTTKQHIAQLILSGSPTGTVYVDNVYFYNSSTTSVDKLSAGDISVYPNPVSDVLNIRSEKSLKSVVITNLVGQTVKSVQPNSNETKISINELATGNYMVQFTTADGRVMTQKILKK